MIEKHPKTWWCTHCGSRNWGAICKDCNRVKETAPPRFRVEMGPPISAEEMPSVMASAARNAFKAGHPRAAMTGLAGAFHALRHKNPPGVEPWEPEKLLAWCKKMRGRITRHEFGCAHFVLSVWNLHDTEDELGKLDVMELLGGWDASHRAAFIAWASDPWWP